MKDEYKTGFEAEYLVQDSPDSIDKLFDQDRRDLLDRIDKIQGFMDQRMKIMYDNLYQIDQDSCGLGTRVEGIKQTQPYETQQISQLERGIFDLEKQKRHEKEAAWKDVWHLNKELITLMKEYQNMKKMEDFGK